MYLSNLYNESHFTRETDKQNLKIIDAYAVAVLFTARHTHLALTMVAKDRHCGLDLLSTGATKYNRMRSSSSLLTYPTILHRLLLLLLLPASHGEQTELRLNAAVGAQFCRVKLHMAVNATDCHSLGM